MESLTTHLKDAVNNSGYGRPLRATPCYKLSGRHGDRCISLIYVFLTLEVVGIRFDLGFGGCFALAIFSTRHGESIVLTRDSYFKASMGTHDSSDNDCELVELILSFP